MNKESFNKLTIDEQIEYINEKLKEANSLTNICKNISIGRSTISDRFKKHNYKFNKISNQYELIENNANITNVIKGGDNGSNTTVTSVDNTSNDTVLDIMNMSNDDVKNNLLTLASEYEIIKQMIEDYRRNSAVVKQQIIIDLPIADSKLTTLRVNSEVLDMFNRFAETNKQYRKVDLLSQALLDFINNHK